jgi:hypothetical protein
VLQDFRIISARLAKPREIAFHVRHEYRHTARAEILRERLECDRFPRASCAGDQAVTIRHLRQQKDLFRRLGYEDCFTHGKPFTLSLIRASCRVCQ